MSKTRLHPRYPRRVIETNARAEALIASGAVDRAIAAIRIDPGYVIAIAQEAQRLAAKHVSISAAQLARRSRERDEIAI
jgi:hypothetical protein